MREVVCYVVRLSGGYVGSYRHVYGTRYTAEIVTLSRAEQYATEKCARTVALKFPGATVEELCE